MSKITLKSLIADYRRDKLAEEVAGDWGSALVYRPLAFVLAWPLARLRVPPTAVTLSGSLLLPAIVAIAVVVPTETAVPLVCMLGALFCVLDCVDGTLARALRRESTFGYYTDLSSDLIYRPTIYAALGHLADRLAGSAQSTTLAIALLAAWLALFARVARLYGEKLLPQPPATAPPRPAVDASAIAAAFYTALSGMDTLLPLLALALWWLGALPVLFTWLLIYSAADAIYAQATTLWALRGV